MAFEIAAFPQDPPYAALMEAYRIIKGGTVQAEFHSLSLAEFNIQGFVQGKVSGKPLMGDVPLMTEDEFFECCEQAKIVHSTSGAMVEVGDFPWAKVLKFIQSVLPLVLPLIV